jgi:hypothetical protein
LLLSQIWGGGQHGLHGLAHGLQQLLSLPQHPHPVNTAATATKQAILIKPFI